MILSCLCVAVAPSIADSHKRKKEMNRRIDRQKKTVGCKKMCREKESEAKSPASDCLSFHH